MESRTRTPDGGARTEDAAPDRWRRDHPVFTALAGFFTGLLLVTVVPGGWIGLLRLVFDYRTAEDLFWLVLLVLVVPIALVGAGRTRRFGLYLLLGMVSTALVVLGVASLVLWLMVVVER